MREVIDSYQINKEDQAARKLVPFIAILVKNCDAWKEKVNPSYKNNGNLPKSFEEQQAFRKIIQQEGADLEKPENYPEALSNAAYAFKTPNEIPDNVQALLDMCDDFGTQDSFWLFVKALKQFISEKGSTPVSGVIPDFHSDTDSYVKIKNLYNEQAQKDYQEILRIAEQLAGDGTVDKEELKVFCRNWQFAEAITMRPLQKVVNSEWLYEEDPAGFGWYFVFRAADKFFKAHGKYANPDDKEELKKMVAEEVLEAGVEDYTVEDKFVEEM